MTREQLEHAIRAACDVAQETELYIFGSQAILGQYPDAPELLRMSVEADVAPKNFPDRADMIDGNLGELSMFHETHGFYVHGLQITAATLPAGWESRTIKVQSRGTREKHRLVSGRTRLGGEQTRSVSRQGSRVRTSAYRRGDGFSEGTRRANSRAAGGR